MLEDKNIVLKYKSLWILVGLSMVVFVIQVSLTSNPPSLDFEMSDKYMHTVGYFGLMGWFIQIYHQQKARYILAAIFIAMGIGLEFLQELGGVRYYEVSDMLANTLGVLLAWALVKTPFPKLLGWFESKLPFK